ncbi:MAG: hypothetical protein ABJN26_06590 [Stappiaceae bacterium]
MTLYLRLGGRQTLKSAVLVTLDFCQDDPLLSPLMSNCSRDDLEEHVGEYLCFFYGGAPNFYGPSVRKINENFYLTDEHFDRMTDYLADAFRFIGTPADLTKEAIITLDQMRDYMLFRLPEDA